jgi:hypothetical protein
VVEIGNTLWSGIFNHVGLAWIMPKRVEDIFACRRGLGGISQSPVAWKMVPSCLLCCFWRENNDTSFEEFKRTVVEASFVKKLLKNFILFFCFLLSLFKTKILTNNSTVKHS